MAIRGVWQAPNQYRAFRLPDEVSIVAMYAVKVMKQSK